MEPLPFLVKFPMNRFAASAKKRATWAPVVVEAQARGGVCHLRGKFAPTELTMDHRAGHPRW